MIHWLIDNHIIVCIVLETAILLAILGEWATGFYHLLISLNTKKINEQHFEHTLSKYKRYKHKKLQDKLKEL